jgi:hypothetical protein
MFGIARRMPPAASYGLGPGGYPMLVTGVLIVLGAVLSIQGWLQVRRRYAQDGASADSGEAGGAVAPEKKVISLREFKGIVFLAVSFWAYITLMKYLGYLITTPVFMFLFLLQYGERKWRRMILVSLISAGLSWGLFTYLFRIFLPDFYFF